MDEKFLFKKFSVDKRVYNLNQGYWKRKLQSELKKKLSKKNELFKNIDSEGKKIYDANPIFTFLDSKKNRGIRIIQDDFNLLPETDNYLEKDLIDAWIDEISIFPTNHKRPKGREKIKELVIALFLTRETVSKTMKLISFWLDEKLDSERIERILEK